MFNGQVYSPRQLHTNLPQFSQCNCVLNILATFKRAVLRTELPRNHLVSMCYSSRPPRTACQMLEEYMHSLGCFRI